MKVKQISVFMENQPGRLAAVADVLGGAGINIMAMTISETREFGVVRMIVADWERGLKFLKDKGFTVTITDVLAIEMEDNPGALAKVLEVFVSRGLNVEYMYSFVAKRAGRAILVFRFDNPDKALSALKGTEVKVLTSEEALALQK